MEVGGVRQYVQLPNSETGRSEYLVGVRASDGKQLWELHCPKTVGTAICRDDQVYASSMNGCWSAKIVPEGDKFAVKLLYAFTLSVRLPTALKEPLHSSVTL